MRDNPTTLTQKLKELALIFLKLGTIAFGGPAANIAMMEQEFVQRRSWLTQREFLDLMGATNLIPGPNSTEMAIHIGRKRAGVLGLLVAGICFVIPAMTLVWCAAWAYVKFGYLPRMHGLFYGIKPVMIAIIAQALWRLSRAAFPKKILVLLCAAAVAANVLGVNEVAVLFGTGFLAIFWERATSFRLNAGSMSLLGLPFFAQPFSGLQTSGKLAEMFFIFVKIGSVLFGSGYVLLAFFQSDFVDHRHWITQAQLLDAVAVGQLTPGPVFTSATFVGYLIAGHQGALLATLGIFLPAFVFVAVSGPLIPLLRKSKVMNAFLDGVNVASIALMAVVGWQLGMACLVDVPSVLVAVLSLLVLLLFRINPAWLIVVAGSLGLLFFSK